MRDGQISQITHDDTFVQTLIDDGRITAEEANSHPQRSLLLRALNGQDVEPDLSMREARDGDRYLLCSDGLSGVVSEETLAEALKDPDPQSTADRLIELALRSGGPDNVTVIVADVIEDGGRGGAHRAGRRRRRRWQRRPARRSTAARRPAAPRSPIRRPPRRRRRHRRRAVAPPPAAARCDSSWWRWPCSSCSWRERSVRYAWALGHWFVGVDGTGDDEQVAVFRGLDVSVVGFDLFEVDRGHRPRASPTSTPAARSRVRGGITADDADDADRILDGPARPAAARSAATRPPAQPSAPLRHRADRSRVGHAARPPAPAATAATTPLPPPDDHRAASATLGRRTGRPRRPSRG